MFSSGEKLESDLDCWHAATVWVVFWILTKLSEDGVFTDWDALFPHLCCKIAKVVVNLTDHSIGIFAREEKVEQVPNEC